MHPENENQEDEPIGGEETAVVVDLSEPLEKQEKPLTDDKSGDKGGKQDDTNDDVDADKGARANDAAADDDLDDAPKPWRKRLKREIRQKVEARGVAAAETQAREAAETRAIAAEAEVTRLKAERVDPVPSTVDIDAKITAATTRLATAIEDGKSADQAAIQAELADLTSQKHARLATPRRAAPAEQRRPEQRPTAKTVTPTGKAFVEANDDWWNDPEQAAARSAVVAIDQQLMAAGSDPNSEKHYDRIARRAKAMGLKVKIRQPFDDGDDMNDSTVDLDDDDQPRQRGRRQPPQGGNGTGRQRVDTSVRDARAGKIVLTEDDKKVMVTFKLNPADPKHMRAFAKARQERVLQESGQ